MNALRRNISYITSGDLMSKRLGPESYKTPAEALSQLIANSLDANATRIDIDVEFNSLGAAQKIIVSDDGYGISPRSLATAFASIGQHQDVGERTRPTIGSRGLGRFACFKLGPEARWCSVAQDEETGDRVRQEWVMAEGRTAFDASLEQADGENLGTKIEIVLRQDTSLSHFLESNARVRRAVFNAFASYLCRYGSSVTIFVNSEPVILEDYIESRTSENIAETEECPGARIDHVIMGNRVDQPFQSTIMYSANGASVYSEALDVPPPSGKYYLGLVESSYIEEVTLASKSDLINMDPKFINLRDAASDRAARFIGATRGGTEQRLIDRVRGLSNSPIRGEPRSPVDELNRDVFEQTLVLLERKQRISNLSNPALELVSKLTYRVLGDPNLDHVLTSVLGLDESDVKKLSSLIRRASLESVVAMSDMLIGRFQFLDELNFLVYGDVADKILERRQLHKILERHTWLFGEQFSLMGTDERLKSLLPRVVEEAGGDMRSLAGDWESSPSSREIPDLYLANQRSESGRRVFQHLIIELKRPSCELTPEHVQQLKRYSRSIVTAPSWGKDKHEFTFILVSSEISDDVLQSELQEDQGRYPGLVSRPNYPHPTGLWAYRWSDIMDQRRLEMDFLREQVNLQVTPSALEMLRSEMDGLIPPLPYRSSQASS